MFRRRVTQTIHSLGYFDLLVGKLLIWSHFLLSQEITGCSLPLEFSPSLLSSHQNSKVTLTRKASPGLRLARSHLPLCLSFIQWTLSGSTQHIFLGRGCNRNKRNKTGTLTGSSGEERTRERELSDQHQVEKDAP